MTSFVDDNVFPKLLIIDGAAPSTPASGVIALYVDSADDHLKYKDDGAAIVDITGGLSGGGSAALTKLTETIVAGSVAANINLTSISGSYRNLVITLTGKTDAAVSTTSVRWQANGDTTSIYDLSEVYISGGASVTGGAAAAVDHGEIGYITGTTFDTASAGSLRATFHDYARTQWRKNSQGIFTCVGGSGGTFLNGHTAGHWRSTAAITAIKLFPASGNFAIGTVCTLWGEV